jgi:acyl phosphate:glycerol-3-phosphate acyltransferase
MSIAMDTAFALLCAYLLGSISGAMLIGKFKGVDIRTQGSGNAGATNALRTQGKIFGLATALIDVAKGVLAVALIAPFFQANAMLTLLAAVLGHCFPIFYQFRGGKGASAAVGGLACIAPLLAALVVSLWLVSLTLTGYVGPCTVLAAIVAALLVVFEGTRFGIVDSLSQGYACVMFLVVTLLHHGNIRRFLLGTEPRFQRVRLLHRLFKAGESND